MLGNEKQELNIFYYSIHLCNVIICSYVCVVIIKMLMQPQNFVKEKTVHNHKPNMKLPMPRVYNLLTSGHYFGYLTNSKLLLLNDFI